MKLAKHYFFHFCILILVDIFFLGITIGFMNLKLSLYYIVLLNVVVFAMPIQWHKVLLFFFVCQKLSLLVYMFIIAPSTGLFIKSSIWIGVVVLYLYYLYIELREAYFLPLYSPFDLRNHSYEINGIIEHGQEEIKFHVTNISERGFFCRLAEPSKGKLNLIKGRIRLIDSFFNFTGAVIINKKDGVGVKVDNSEIWDKLYSKVTKLGYLEQI